MISLRQLSLETTGDTEFRHHFNNYQERQIHYRIIIETGADSLLGKLAQISLSEIQERDMVDSSIALQSLNS